LLPLYPGTHVHERILKAGGKITGATVHYVDEKVDHGKICIQMACPVYDNDTIESLKKRVHAIEHRIYPQAIKFIFLKTIQLDQRREK
jgi:phosphoribosylglycinamide formyltransferase-1